MNTDRQTAVRLHRGTEAAREQVDALLDSLNELDDEALRAVDDAFVLELMNAQEHLEALWRLAVASGARRGELLGVAWLGFSAEQKTMTISQQVLPTRGDLSILPCKTKGSHRTIRLDDETADALERHRKRQLEEREAAGDAYDDHDLIFCDELGGPINPQRLTGWFGDLRKTAGVRPGRLHDVRHSVATHLLAAGIPVHIVSARLGHASPVVTLNIYAHARSADKRREGGRSDGRGARSLAVGLQMRR